jgi:hypothetical protein
MTDEPKKRTRAVRIIGSRTMMGVGAGIVIALVNPSNWRFCLECLALGALFGLAVGITDWLTRPAS